jgi:hypothetical protein
LYSGALDADLFYFTPSLGWWAWAGVGLGVATSSISFSAQQYGRFRIPAASNVLGTRYAPAMSIDRRNQRLYIASGYSIDGCTMGDVYVQTSLSWLVVQLCCAGTDVLFYAPSLVCCSWSYDISSGFFTWINGINQCSPINYALYPATKGLSGALYWGSGRGVYGSLGLVDPSGNFWYGMGIFSTSIYCNDLFYLTSPAGVVTVELAPALFSTVVSPLAASTRQGTNNLTLGWTAGFTQDLNFSVIAENSLQGSVFSLRVVQVPPRNSISLSMSFAFTSCSNIVVFQPFSSYPFSVPTFQGITVDAACAYSQAPVSRTLAPGATFQQVPQMTSVTVGARGSTTFLPQLTVIAEDGVTSASVTLYFYVEFLTDVSSKLAVSGAGMVPLTVIPSSVSSLTTIRFNYSSTPIALDNSTLTYWYER